MTFYSSLTFYLSKLRAGVWTLISSSEVDTVPTGAFYYQNNSINTMNKIIAGVATATLFAIASPVFASTGHGWFYSNNGGDITVTNNNSAHVQNTVAVNANTGYNTADGGNGDQGGNGGNATGSHVWWWFQNNGAANAGNAGNGGAGGTGGLVVTGHADALSDIANVVNTNITRITRGL